MFLGKASETCTNVCFSSEQFFPDYNLRTLFSDKNKSLIRIPSSGKNMIRIAMSVIGQIRLQGYSLINRNLTDRLTAFVYFHQSAG